MKKFTGIIMCGLFFCLVLISSSSASEAEGKYTRRGMGAPLPEMMFYEAAEQAVEDGYARIIPDTEDEKAAAKTKEVQGDEGGKETRQEAHPESPEKKQ